MNIVDLLQGVAAQQADQAALIAGAGRRRRRLTFAELAARVERAAGTLRDAGLPPGTRVLLAVPPSIDTYVAMLAVLRAGMVVMFIDPAHGRSTVARALRRQPPGAIIGTRASLLLSRLLRETRQIPQRFTVAASRGLAAGRDRGFASGTPPGVEPRSSADPALLTFTSGSTGEPKAVVRTHGFLGTQIGMLRQVADVVPGDVDLVAMPMFVLFNLSQGITSLLPAANMRRPGRARASLLTAQLISERATRTVASPALLERIARYCARHGQTLPDLRLIATGGGPVGPTLPERLCAIAPNARVRAVYGSTEAEPIAVVDDDAVSASDRARMRDGAGLLVGRPVSGCAVRVIDGRGCTRLGPFTATRFDAESLPAGAVGEIVVSGAHVLAGYSDAAENAATKIDVDDTRWHRTGDAGYFDGRGRLWLVGRASAAIRDRHGEVYPFQIEYAAAALPGIRRAAVLELEGRRILAIEADGSRFAAGGRQLTRCLTRWRIARVVTVRRLPMDRRHDAKIDYPVLRRMLEGRQNLLAAIASWSVSTPA